MTLLTNCPVGTNVFDQTHEAIAGGDVHSAMTTLRRSLHDMRSRLDPGEWSSVGEQARRHPLHDLLLQSPFTRRAFEKPRGYAGDAELMDLIYGLRPTGELTPLGGMLYGYEFDSPCFQSVRTRRAVLAREIDLAATGQATARVLSVASGHLREVEWSRAVRDGTVTITAVDQDRASLGCIERDYARFGVETMAASVGDLLRRTVRFANLDLAYAAGLYDYLDDEVARTLTWALFRTLRPGGRALIANFTPDTYDAAFMETFMDWRLVYRTPAQVRGLADLIPADEVEAIEQFTDDNRHVAYLRVIKR